LAKNSGKCSAAKGSNRLRFERMPSTCLIHPPQRLEPLGRCSFSAICPPIMGSKPASRCGLRAAAPSIANLYSYRSSSGLSLAGFLKRFFHVSPTKSWTTLTTIRSLATSKSFFIVFSLSRTFGCPVSPIPLLHIGTFREFHLTPIGGDIRGPALSSVGPIPTPRSPADWPPPARLGPAGRHWSARKGHTGRPGRSNRRSPASRERFWCYSTTPAEDIGRS
jgi:hypothetical protein